VASYLAGSPMPESEEVARETVCELANMVIGSAVTVLNDQGFHFKINPPVVHADDLGEKSSEEQEALVMCFDTAGGRVFMNIAMRYGRRRRADNRPS
jgi:chemotaxis protein CheX